MDEKPKRRWFRFRLSTVLILTAITAWGMARRPDQLFHFSRATHGYVGLPATAAAPPHIGDLFPDRGRTYYRIDKTALIRRLAYPAIALAAFLAWKAAWAMVEASTPRRRRARMKLWMRSPRDAGSSSD
jgi:hypothetical protein